MEDDKNILKTAEDKNNTSDVLQTDGSENTTSSVDNDSNVEQPVSDESEIDSTAVPEPKVYALDEDYEKLCKINVFQAMILKFQKGRHPSKEIDELLDRRIKLSQGDFEGPFVVRVISSIIMISLSGLFAWIFIWSLGIYLGEKLFLFELSASMATMICALIGVVFFQPTHLIDEKDLKKAVADQMKILEYAVKDAKDDEKPVVEPGVITNE